MRIGLRSTALIGLAFAVFGTASLWFLTNTGPVAIVAIYCFGIVIGIGMGVISTSALISAQSSVPWDERGVANYAHSWRQWSIRASLWRDWPGDDQSDSLFVYANRHRI